MSDNDPDWICGESEDHVVDITYQGEDGVGWRCLRCDIEGWSPADENEEA